MTASFRVLGPLTIAIGGRTVPIPEGRERALLSWLLLHGRRGVTVGATADALWPHADPVRARQSVSWTASRLRFRLQLAGADTTLTCSGGRIALDIGASALDAREFDRRAAAGCQAIASARPHAAEPDLRAALALWRGDAYPDLADTDAGTAEAVRLRHLWLDAAEALAALRLADRADAQLVPDLTAIVAHSPVRERSWRLLMTALATGGRNADALRAYQRCRVELDGVGLRPSLETRQAEADVLAHRPFHAGAMLAAEFPAAPRPPSSGEVLDLVMAELFDAAGARLVLVAGADESRRRLLTSLGTQLQAMDGALVDLNANPAATTAELRTAARLGPLGVIVRDIDGVPNGPAAVRRLADALEGSRSVVVVTIGGGGAAAEANAEMWRLADRRYELAPLLEAAYR